MHALFLLLTLVVGLWSPVAMAEDPSAGEAASEGLIAVEMAVWSTQGQPTVTASVMGEQRTRQMELTEDGVYSATFKVPYGRLLPVTLRLGSGRVTEDLVVLEHSDHRVAWVLEKNGDFFRSSSPASRERTAFKEALLLIGGGLWILLIGFVLLGGRLERGGKPLVWRLPEPVWFLMWLLMSIAWTWPSALSNASVVAGRHFDTLGTLWVIGSAERLFSDIDVLTAWPLGGDLTRLDSYLLIPVAWMLSALGAGKIFGWLTILGVALNAWAAQHFARAIGARAPWTILAGVGFGFCGLAATGILEGHIYQVFNPWLPWFGAALWRATDEQGSIKAELLALALFVLCWLTTAYIGVVALGLALAVLWFSRRRPVVLLVGSLIFLVAYVAWYMHGDAPAREALEGLNPMSAHFAGMLAATPEMDRVEHSMAPVVFGWMLGLLLLARTVLEPGRWRAILVAAFGALFLSMIPGFAAGPDLVLLPVNLDWVTGPVAGFLRFPIRWVWLWSLCGGVLASLVATRLAARWGRLGWLVLAVVVLEAFIRIGTPYRTELRYIEAPEQLTRHEGGVLELLPVTENRGVNWDRWMSNVSCVEQLAHGQPIAEDCIHTKPRKLRHRLNFWLQDRVFRGDMEGAEATLAALNFQTIMLRPDLFNPQDASRMEAGLKKIDRQPDVVREKGVHAVMFTVTGEADRDVQQVLQSLELSASPKVSRRNWMGAAHHGRFNGLVALGTWFVVLLGLGLALRMRGQRQCDEG